ncbi:MAG TPA: response regulator [Deltaproteobacteria bacterium]|nr:response regulator [Deltaproteobacteria bacterium]HQB37684.1 response regulator [Deltaproteobacteria bacterium]
MVSRILLVDDSPISRRMLKSCIPKDRGYEFFEAGDGQAGLELWQEVRPDVTFMDLTMPVMDGLSATREIIRLDPQARIIVCTADIQVRSLEQAREAGALTVVRKPPSKETVEDAISFAETRG